MKKSSKAQKLRLGIQLFFFVLSMAILYFVISTGSKAIHNACPYAVVCFGMNTSSIIKMIYLLFPLSVFLGLLFLLSSVFWGRKFCSYVCPLGTFQEGVFQLRKLKYRMKTRVPFFYEKRFAPLKYIVLIVTGVLVVSRLAYLYINFCPIYALSQIPFLNYKGLIVLGLIAVGALLTERLWCRFLCPYAALFNVFQWIGKLFGIKRRKIHRNLEKCIDCCLCNMNCPMNINVTDEDIVHDPNCIGCGMCTEKCPKPGTLCEEREKN